MTDTPLAPKPCPPIGGAFPPPQKGPISGHTKRRAPNTVITVFISASSIERNMRMTATNPIHDHYTVISHAGELDTLRVVIAGSIADAAKTHREHHPGDAIIRVGRATPSVKLTG